MYHADVGDIIETELLGETVRARVERTRDDRDEFIARTIDKINGRQWSIIRTPRTSVNITKGERAEIEYMRNVVGALNAWVAYWDDLQKTRGWHDNIFVNEIKHILETGENPRGKE